MEEVEQQRLESAAMFNWLADIFYQVPTAEKLTVVTSNLANWPKQSTELQVHINAILGSIEADGCSEINQDFHRLFIGPGEKEVYPWGSVHIDEEALLFGPSSIAWKQFCVENNINVQPEKNEPTDHFALFFSALAAVMQSEYHTQEKSRIVNQILHNHFQPWGLKVLLLIQEKAQTNYFKGFALLAEDLLKQTMAETQ